MLRTIRYEEPAKRAADDAVERYERGEDAVLAIEWAIVRDPRIGTALTESGNIRSFTFDGARSIGLPTVTALYVIEEEQIIFHSLKFSDAKYSYAGKS